VFSNSQMAFTRGNTIVMYESVRVCVCLYECVTRYQPDALGCTIGRRAVDLGALERQLPLVLGSVKRLWCHVTLTDLFSAEVTPPKK